MARHLRGDMLRLMDGLHLIRTATADGRLLLALDAAPGWNSIIMDRRLILPHTFRWANKSNHLG